MDGIKQLAPLMEGWTKEQIAEFEAVLKQVQDANQLEASKKYYEENWPYTLLPTVAMALLFFFFFFVCIGVYAKKKATEKTK